MSGIDPLAHVACSVATLWIGSRTHTGHPITLAVSKPNEQLTLSLELFEHSLKIC